MFFASVITSSLTPGLVILSRFLTAFTVLIASLAVKPCAKGTEQPCNRTKEIIMNIFKFVFVPFIVLIYLILVIMSIPKKASVYAAHLIVNQGFSLFHMINRMIGIANTATNVKSDIIIDTAPEFSLVLTTQSLSL